MSRVSSNNTILFLLIDNNGHTIACMCVKPGYLILLHIDAAMTTSTSKRLVTTDIVVWVVGANTVVHAPPAIVQEVATIAVFHCKVDIRVWIPECRPFRLTRFEDRRRLTIEYMPKARR